MSLIVQLCFLAALLLTVDGQNVFNQTFPGDASALSRKLDEQKGVIDRQAADLIMLGNISSILLEKINEQKTIISEKEATINRHVADLSQLKSNASSLLKKTNDDAKTISEQNKVIDRHVADIGEARNNPSALMRKLNEQNDEIDKLKNNAAENNLKVSICLGNITKEKSAALGLSHEIKRLRDQIAEKDGRHAADITKLKDNSTALQRTIDDQKKIMELQAADINKLTNNASILMDTISSQMKTISEKEAVIASRGNDINQLKNKINEHTLVMLLGGWHDEITNSTTIYDSMEKSWKNCNLTLPSTLGGHGAALLNNEIYIFGGYADGTTQEPLKSLYKLEAGNKWERMADMTEKRGSLSQSYVVFNSEIWVIGGWNGTNILKSVEKYNPKTNNWIEMPELNESRTHAAATVVGGKIYVSGGWYGRKTKNSMEVYDPEKGKWEIFTPSMPYAVHSHILIGNHSHLIAIGGDLSKQEPTNQVWKIDVLDSKREWKVMPSLQQKRYHSGAAIIADELMVFGGSINNITRTDSVEIFDGVKWKDGAPLPEKRGSFASIPLTWAQERLFLKRFCQNY